MRRFLCVLAIATSLLAPPARAQTPALVQADLSDGQEFDDCGGQAWCPRMVVAPAGRFIMGSPANEPGRGDDEGPQHEVSVPRFAVGKFEVTFAQWDACAAAGGCARNPHPQDQWGRGRRPVMNVSWNDAQDYVAWLSRSTGQRYRLLTEAEWEYAARAGAPTRFWWGRNTSPRQAQYNWTYNGAPNFSAPGQTAEVGAFAPNAFGLYDVHGNVAEWVADCYRDTYDGAPNDASAYTPTACAAHVVRGGSWNEIVPELRSAERAFPVYGDQRFWMWGFRVARNLVPDARPAPAPFLVWVDGGLPLRHPFTALFMRNPHPPRGRAELDCTIDAGGVPRCTLISETPAGHGFGAAALQAVERYRARPLMSDGATPSLGVRAPLVFYLPGPGL